MTALPVTALPELNLFEIIGGIKRRLYLVMVFPILFMAFGFLALSVSPQKYEAHTQLTLETRDQNYASITPNMPGGNVLLPPMESVMLSQVEMLQSHDLADAVVTDMKLDQNSRFWHKSIRPQETEKAHQKAVLMVANNLTVRPIGRSLVINIAYRHADAEMAANIVNRYAQIFQELQVREKITHTRKTNLWLEKRLEILNGKMRDSARAVEDYRTREDLIDGAKAEITSQQISDISSQLMQAQAEEAGILARKSQMGDVLKSKGTLDNIPEANDSHLINLFKHNEVVLKSQLAQLQSKYGPNHPKILSVKAELGELSARKNKEVSRLTNGVDNEVLTITAKIKLLQKNLQEVEQKRRRENQAAIGLRELQSEAEANQQLYNNFLNRYKESKLLDGDQQADIKIITIAKPPLEPSGPNPILIMLIVSFSGVIFGALMALMLEQLDVAVRTPEQLYQLTGVDTLSVIPKIRHGRKHISANYVFEYPYEPTTEALRTLCLRLLGRIEKRPSVVTLTSCLPEDGKTITLLGIAKIMAKSGLRVVLVDGNFRHPGLPYYIDYQSDFSVSDFILKRVTASRIVVKDKQLPNLSIITGKPSSADDVAALSSQAIEDALSVLKTDADIILIDAPSMQIAETQLLNRIADDCLIAVHWDKTPMRIVASVFRQMHQDKNRISGYIITEESMT